MAGLEFTSWYGVWGPKSLPAAIVKRLNTVMAEAARDPANIERLTSLGLDLVIETPEDMARVIEADVKRGATLLQAANYKPE